MYCTRCGNTLADSASFCGACGQATNATSAMVPQKQLEPPLTLPVVLPYAGFWRRFVAYLIDGIMTLAVIGATLGVTLLALRGLGLFRQVGQRMRGSNPRLEGGLVAAFIAAMLILFVGNWLYFALMESSDHQATLGKMAIGIAVTNLNGQRITFARASGRYFAKMISSLISFQIGYIMVGFTERKQALHDLIASCLVLKTT